MTVHEGFEVPGRRAATAESQQGSEQREHSEQIPRARHSMYAPHPKGRGGVHVVAFRPGHGGREMHPAQVVQAPESDRDQDSPHSVAPEFRRQVQVDLIPDHVGERSHQYDPTGMPETPA